MSIMVITLFRKAGAVGHVFLLRGGKSPSNKGLAYSGLIGPMTTVAVVPTTPQILSFAIEAKSKDKQSVEVEGDVTVTLDPAVAVSKFDFTVDAKSGGYLGTWNSVLKAKVIERVTRSVLSKVREFDVETVTSSQKEIEDAVIAALGSDAFAADGVTINSCSIPQVTPMDEDVAEAIGAQERQVMLTTADKAVHGRRLKASHNERAVKQYDAGTKLALEKDQGALLAEQAKNEQTKAEIDAKATETRLKPLSDVDPGTMLGAALMEMSKSGRIGSLAIGPELLAALQQHK
jgi:hypothetical protein